MTSYDRTLRDSSVAPPPDREEIFHDEEELREMRSWGSFSYG